MTNLPQEISGLSEAEKFELLNALGASLEANPVPLTSELSEELDQREAR